MTQLVKPAEGVWVRQVTSASENVSLRLMIGTVLVQPAVAGLTFHPILLLYMWVQPPTILKGTNIILLFLKSFI